MSVEKLKAEIFDLIAIQDNLRIQYGNIEKQKQAKLTELQALQKKEKNNVNTKVMPRSSNTLRSLRNFY